MRLRSTRRGSGEVSFRRAVFAGLAPDGGLFHPVSQPDLRELFGSIPKSPSFLDLAEELTVRLFCEEMDRHVARRIVRRAFPFAPALIEVKKDLHLLELFHGPTCAFKDFGAGFLAAAMEEFLAGEDREAVILVATSGDTGSAVARAFHGKRNIRVVILYPAGRVSPLQEKQLTTLGGNVCALEVEGSFDDCQRLAKQAFMDRELAGPINLTSANSINVGRLIPQAFYYVYAYAALQPEPEEPVYFCVPSGNFGNLTAGVYAWEWGLPVRGFIAATNANDVVPEYLETGRFRPRSSVSTLSNAMDVGNPSNFERLLCIFDQKPEKMRRLISGERVSDRETRETIGSYYRKHGICVDPHTAVGLRAVEGFRRSHPGRADHLIVLATAHPGKFLKVVEEETGSSPELPETLREAMGKEKESVPIGNRYPELAAFLREHYL